MDSISPRKCEVKKGRERERVREISSFQPLRVEFLVEFADKRQISKPFKYKNNYGDDDI